MLEEIVSLYEAYLEEFRRLERNRRPMEGVFGIGNGPQNYPCHGKFAQDLERMLKDLSAQALSSEQAGQVLRYIYCTAPVRWESVTTVYWMLLAVHGLTGELIERLDASTAKALCEEYRRLYPRYQRLPVQNRVFSALQSKARYKQKKR